MYQNVEFQIWVAKEFWKILIQIRFLKDLTFPETHLVGKVS